MYAEGELGGGARMFLNEDQETERGVLADKLPDGPTTSRLKLGQRGPGRPTTEGSGGKLERHMLCSGQIHAAEEAEEVSQLRKSLNTLVLCQSNWLKPSFTKGYGHNITLT